MQLTKQLISPICLYCYLTNRFLKENLSYIDDNKIGIWGWSFGGYVAGMVLAKDNENIFKCAVSVAPITDWIYYGIVLDTFLLNANNLKLRTNRYKSIYRFYVH